MADAETPPPARSRDEVARLGKAIYERDVRRQVETDHDGEVVAIDVDSGGWALGGNAIAASESLRGRHPDAEVWLMRVGHRALYRFSKLLDGGRVVSTIKHAE